MTKESPFACDMTAIAANQRDQHIAIIGRLFRSVKCVKEVSDGYRFEFPTEKRDIEISGGLYFVGTVMLSVFWIHSRN